MSVVVKEISEKELNQFIKLPFKLYKNDPNWVPPLFLSEREMLDAKKNTFLRNGKHAFFIAFRGKEAVARVLAGLNEPVSTKTGVVNGYFSLFEAKDEESGLAVLEAAENFCRSIGAARMVGPYSPTNGEEYRALLIEGFGFPPVLNAAYNPEWYKGLFEKFGLSKSADLLAFKISTDTMPIEKFRYIVSFAQMRFGFSAKRLDLNNLERELKDIQQILNEADIEDWDSGIPTWEMIEQAADSLRSMADPDFIYIVRRNDGRPLAFVVCLPNYNEVLIHMKGRLLPFGIIKFVYWRKRIKSLRVLMQFCVKDYERTAAVSAAYLGIMEEALAKGYEWGDASTIGEENKKSWLAVQGAGGEVYRRYRWFVKEL